MLDGIIQCTERDEYGYHEIMVHVPLFAHPSPTKVREKIPSYFIDRFGH